MQNMNWCKLDDAHDRFIFSYKHIKIFEEIITRKNGFYDYDILQLRSKFSHVML